VHVVTRPGGFKALGVAAKTGIDFINHIILYKEVSATSAGIFYLEGGFLL
jgi:hypothetical protein